MAQYDYQHYLAQYGVASFSQLTQAQKDAIRAELEALNPPQTWPPTNTPSKEKGGK